MIFGKNTTRGISKLSQISLAITYNNFEISLVVFMPNITTNHAITYTKIIEQLIIAFCWGQEKVVVFTGSSYSKQSCGMAGF